MHIVRIDNLFDPAQSYQHWRHGEDSTIGELLLKYVGTQAEPQRVQVYVNRQRSTQLEQTVGGDDQVLLIPLPQGEVFVTALITALIATAISLVIALIFAPDIPDLSDIEQGDPVARIAPQSNQARLNQVIPEYFGTNLIYPDLKTQPWIMYENNDQYVYHVLSIGYGTYDIDQLYIEDTEIDEFEEVETETALPTQSITSFPTDVITSTEVSNVELEDDGTSSAWITVNDASKSVNKIQVDISHPGGLVAYSKKGRTRSAFSTIRVDYREVGETTYQSKTKTFRRATRTPQNDTITIDSTDFADLADGGRWEVRVTQTSATGSGARSTSDARWETLRGFVEPVDDSGANDATTRVAIKMKVTSQISDRATRKIRAKITRKLPIYNFTSETWGPLERTNRACWAAAHLIRSQNGMHLPDDVINYSELEDLKDHEEANSFEFHGAILNKARAWDVLRRICAAVLAQPRTNYFHIGFAAEDLINDETPVFAYGEHNIVPGTFQETLTRLAEDSTDSAVITYRDEDADYKDRSVNVVPEHSSGENPKTITVYDIHDRTQAYKYGAYQIGREIAYARGASFESTFAGGIPKVGDVVLLALYPRTWGQSGEVRAIEWRGDKVFYIDLDSKIDNTSNLKLRLIKNDGTLTDEIPVKATNIQITTSEAGDPDTFTFTRQATLDGAFDFTPRLHGGTRGLGSTPGFLWVAGRLDNAGTQEARFTSLTRNATTGALTGTTANDFTLTPTIANGEFQQVTGMARKDNHFWVLMRFTVSGSTITIPYYFSIGSDGLLTRDSSKDGPQISGSRHTAFVIGDRIWFGSFGGDLDGYTIAADGMLTRDSSVDYTNPLSGNFRGAFVKNDRVWLSQIDGSTEVYRCWQVSDAGAFTRDADNDHDYSSDAGITLAVEGMETVGDFAYVLQEGSGQRNVRAYSIAASGGEAGTTETADDSELDNRIGFEDTDRPSDTNHSDAYDLLSADRGPEHGKSRLQYLLGNADGSPREMIIKEVSDTGNSYKIQGVLRQKAVMLELLNATVPTAVSNTGTPLGDVSITLRPSLLWIHVETDENNPDWITIAVSPVPGAARYVFEFRHDETTAGEWQTIGSTDHPTIRHNVEGEFDEYQVRARACSEDACGDWITWGGAVGEPALEPSDVEDLAANFVGREVIISWTVDETADRYELSIDKTFGDSWQRMITALPEDGDTHEEPIAIETLKDEDIGRSFTVRIKAFSPQGKAGDEATLDVSNSRPPVPVISGVFLVPGGTDKEELHIFVDPPASGIGDLVAYRVKIQAASNGISSLTEIETDYATRFISIDVEGLDGWTGNPLNSDGTIKAINIQVAGIDALDEGKFGSDADPNFSASTAAELQDIGEAYITAIKASIVHAHVGTLDFAGAGNIKFQLRNESGKPFIAAFDDADDDDSPDEDEVLFQVGRDGALTARDAFIRGNVEADRIKADAADIVQTLHVADGAISAIRAATEMELNSEPSANLQHIADEIAAGRDYSFSHTHKTFSLGDLRGISFSEHAMLVSLRCRAEVIFSTDLSYQTTPVFGGGTEMRVKLLANNNNSHNLLRSNLQWVDARNRYTQVRPVAGGFANVTDFFPGYIRQDIDINHGFLFPAGVNFEDVDLSLIQEIRFDASASTPFSLRESTTTGTFTFKLALTSINGLYVLVTKR